MMDLTEAQARLLALASQTPVESVSLIDAAGRWAAADLGALRTQPARDLSAMDGYAIRFAERPGPWRLIGESAAGRSFDGAVAPCEAVRIFTGAALPDGADTILIQEDAIATDGIVEMTGEGPPAKGAHVRLAGSDFRAGDPILSAGDLVTSARIALAALAGHAHIPVNRKPRIALISTGDELRVPGSPDLPDTIPASNAPMLAALLAPVAEVTDLGIVADDLDTLRNCFSGIADVDIVITTGGASVGDHDLVRPALEAAGADLDFWKIAMRPGKPVMAGQLGDAIVLGLPGNPVSAYVTAFLLALPLARHMGGATDPFPKLETAILGRPLPANGPRLDHRRAVLDGGIVTPVPSNDSAMLEALASSNAFIVRHPNAAEANAGDIVELYRHP
jgi:molybdopterin molybdotransferase